MRFVFIDLSSGLLLKMVVRDGSYDPDYLSRAFYMRTVPLF